VGVIDGGMCVVWLVKRRKRGIQRLSCLGPIRADASGTHTKAKKGGQTDTVIKTTPTNAAGGARTGVEGAVVDDVRVHEGQGQVGDAAQAGVGENEAGHLGGYDL
jgi:hypothetical protein